VHQLNIPGQIRDIGPIAFVILAYGAAGAIGEVGVRTLQCCLAHATHGVEHAVVVGPVDAADAERNQVYANPCSVVECVDLHGFFERLYLGL